MYDRISCREGVDGYGKLGINLGNRSKVAEPATVVGCREYGQHLPSYDDHTGAGSRTGLRFS